MHLNVPGEQTIPHNVTLVFGANRSISITDEDAGLGVLELSLSVSGGTLTLGSTAGLDWQAGRTVHPPWLSGERLPALMPPWLV